MLHRRKAFSLTVNKEYRVFFIKKKVQYEKVIEPSSCATMTTVLREKTPWSLLCPVTLGSTTCLSVSKGENP